jgi:hypothetical protein
MIFYFLPIVFALIPAPPFYYNAYSIVLTITVPREREAGWLVLSAGGTLAVGVIRQKPLRFSTQHGYDT